MMTMSLGRKGGARTCATSRSAYDCYLLAREHLYWPGDSGYREAERLFEKAIALNPGFARAYSALAWLHFLCFKSVGTASFDSVEQKALDLALHALRLGPDEYRAHWVFCALYMGASGN